MLTKGSSVRSPGALSTNLTENCDLFGTWQGILHLSSAQKHSQWLDSLW